MVSARDWIVLGRPHTASLTIPVTLLGAVAAGGGDAAQVALLGLWALLFHYFGFVHNNLADLPHDRADPSKAHFPLVSGAIPPARARALWLAGTALLALLGLALLARAPGGLAPGALALAVAIGAGAGYNELSKRSRSGPFLIAASFAALPAFAFFASGGTLGDCGDVAAIAAKCASLDPRVILYVVAYSFALMLHDIGYAGYLKDLAPDPVNWLRAMGARAEPRGEGRYAYAFPPRVQAWAWTSRLLCPAMALAWLALFPGQAQPLALALTALFAVLLAVVFARLGKPGEFPRQRKLALMGASEAIAYFVLAASLAPQLGTLGEAAFLVLPLAWFVAWNRVLWGTTMGPRV